MKSLIPLLFALVVALSSSVAAAQDTPDTWDRLGAEPRSEWAATELALGQAFHGLVVGFDACVSFECNSAQAWVGLPLFLAVIGTSASLFAVGSEGTYPGLTNTFNSAPNWGWGIGLATGHIAGLSARAVAGSRIIGMSAALGGSYFIADALRPTAGDVAMVNAAGIWSLLYYLMIVEGIMDRDQTDRARAVGLLTTTLTAGTGAAVATYYMPMSRSRLGLVQLTAFGGGLLGMLATIDTDSSCLRWATILGTTTAAFALGFFLTRDWDPDVYSRP